MDMTVPVRGRREMQAVLVLAQPETVKAALHLLPLTAPMPAPLPLVALLQVMVAEVDSHKVFRMVSDAKGLAVLLLEGASIPAPYQLAASLKKQQSLDAL